MTSFNIRIFSDGAVLKDMLEMLNNSIVTGFTTNPSLMKKAGITSYIDFAKDVLYHIKNYPVSFEVFSDTLDNMEKEALRLSQLGENVYVKIPVMTSTGESTTPLIKKLSDIGVKLNVTAIFTIEQVKSVVEALNIETPSIVSVFAGRIADTGTDPEPIMREALKICHTKPHCKLLWASPREVWNIYQANNLGVDIITCTPDIIKKLDLRNKDLTQFSKETVQMFLNDTKALGFSILD